MPHAEVVDDGRIGVITEFIDKDLIRAVPGSTWDPQQKIWHVPLSWGSCKVLRGLFGDRLVIGPQLNTWAWTERQQRVEPALSMRLATTWENGAQLDTDLYPFQDVGAEFLVTARQALLADEMGTGKTVQAIRAFKRLHERGCQPYPVCVITPNSVKRPWLREWERWDPQVHVILIDGSAPKRLKQFTEAADLAAAGALVAVVINIEAVRIHSRLAPYGNIRLKRCIAHGGEDDTVKVTHCEVHPKELNDLPFRSVVIDEAHRMKDPQAKQTRAIWAVQHGPTVAFRYALTGTPIANHPGDLWAIMHGLVPGDFPAKTKYIDRYCMQGWAPFGGLDIIGVRPDTRDELYSILDPRMRRMPKDLVLPFLPRKIRPEPRWIEMSPKQAKAYREIDEQLVTKLADGSIILTTNDLARNTRLLQFSSAYATVDEHGDVKLSEPCPKLDELEHIMEELGDEPLVVAAESRQLIEMAAARFDKTGITYRMVTGAVTGDRRDQSIIDFQNGDARVMLMTLKAGGVGITLTRAGVIVFLQRSWSMIDNKQGEDRVHRIGSEIHDKVLIIDMITGGTVEEDQIPKLRAKLERLEEIVRDRSTLESQAATGNTAAIQALERLDAEVAAIEQIPLWSQQQKETAA